MNKFIITRWEGRVLTVLINEEGVFQLGLEDDGEKSLLNNTHVGKVKNVVKNIGAAFVELGNGRTAYYSLTKNTRHHYTKPYGNGPPHAGDETTIQVSRDAVKAKDPIISSNLNFTGRYSMLTAGKDVLGFSVKIADQEWKQEMKARTVPELKDGCGIIARTNAYGADVGEILAEIRGLKTCYKTIMAAGTYRTCYSPLYEAASSYAGSLRDARSGSIDEIIIDNDETCQTLSVYLGKEQPEDLGKLTLYQDNMVSPLKLYSLERALGEAFGRRVWLKSGSYPVIEPAEALTMVDVNTGKYTRKKDPRETILKTNLEAARETARQMRLRNLPGIIIIDFIDMTEEEDQKLLMDSLIQWCQKGPVKAAVVDITKSNLVEVTRKKQRRPLHEIMGDNKRRLM